MSLEEPICPKCCGVDEKKWKSDLIQLQQNQLPIVHPFSTDWFQQIGLHVCRNYGFSASLSSDFDSVKNSIPDSLLSILMITPTMRSISVVDGHTSVKWGSRECRRCQWKENDGLYDQLYHLGNKRKSLHVDELLDVLEESDHMTVQRDIEDEKLHRNMATAISVFSSKLFDCKRSFEFQRFILCGRIYWYDDI